MSNEVNTTVSVEEPKMCTLKEQIGHAIGVLGHDSASTLWSTWMTPFLTDVAQIPAVALGILLAFARIFDGVNDVAMGFIADKSNGRWGRFRSWILRAGPLFCVCVMLSFIVPSSNMTVRIIYASIMYVLVDVVFTAVDIPFWSLPAAMTSNTQERSNILGTTQMASSAISSGIGVILPLLLVYFGGGIEWSAYFKSAVIICSAGIIMYLICFATVREHVVPDPQQKIDFRLGLKNIYQNKPLLLVQFSNLMVILGKVVRGTFGYYFFSYNIGKLEYMSIYSAISIVAGIAGSALFIFLAKFIGKRNIMFVLTIGYVAASAVIYITGWSNLYIFFACNAVAGVCSSGQSVGVNAMMADTMEYGEWKTGQRNEGVITSTRCFVSKVAAAIGGVAVAAVIGLTGYNGGAEVQSMATLNAFHFMISAGCALVTIVGVVPLAFYDLTEAKHAEIVKELAERKANQDKQ